MPSVHIAGAEHLPREQKVKFRSDIQALRALAVLMVFLYHLWPSGIPGGFTGVDVFFVISGYLITSLLVREVDGTGKISFFGFYVRRAARLLPLSLLVLSCIIIVALLVSPKHNWGDVGGNVAAAALYVENWWLHIQAGDYLAGAGALNPAQHFWSLSVEEQFYFFWPLMIFAVFAACKKLSLGDYKKVLSSTFLISIVVSFFYSDWATRNGVASGGYFSTFSRAWQLAVGGCLALMPLRRWTWQPIWVLVGLAGILAGAFCISSADPYPGRLALVPTLAAAVFIYFGGEAQAPLLNRLMSARPVQWLGDVSYSLYLWHWPIIVFYDQYHGGERGVFANVMILGLALLVSHYSKLWVEDKFRLNFTKGRGDKVLLGAGASSLAVASLAVGLGLMAKTSEKVVGEFPGAAAIAQEGFGNSEDEHFVPALVNVKADVASAYAQGCVQQVESSTVLYCIYGDDTAPVKMAVVGDSHAVHWLPAFEEIATNYNVQVLGVTKTSCPLADQVVMHTGIKMPYLSCKDWADNVVNELIERQIGYVVISQSPKYMVPERPEDADYAAEGPLSDGMVRLWRKLQDHGIKVYAIRSTPWQAQRMGDCAANHSWPFLECAGRQEEVLTRSANVVASEKSGASLLDMTDQFCRDGICPAVIGDVFVYRDNAHISATYARTIAPVLLDRLKIDGIERRDAALTSEPAPILPDITTLRPGVQHARMDRGEAFAGHCLHSGKEAVIACEFSAEEPLLDVAIVGDGMAANLVPALVDAGKEGKWRVTTYLKDSCLFSVGPVFSRVSGGDFVECQEWSASVLEKLGKNKPDVVLVAQSPIYRAAGDMSPEASREVLVDGVVDMWGQVQGSGAKIIAFEYMPMMGVNVPECLLDEAQRSSGCYSYKSASARSGVVNDVVELMGIDMIPLVDKFCPGTYCPPQIDGILVYRDNMQPTATFARTLGRDIRLAVEGKLGK